ncbi:MAG: DUF4249 domain-containing protein [Prevotellaceae bacterium]|jgi:hypothetical protein|nr:DUF4249 domain-containing protein [Prevotellaceae bacterium]
MRLFISSILAFILTGCISEFDAKLPSGDAQILIVDGSIVANTEATFHLSKSYSLDNSLSDSVLNAILINDATLTLIDGNRNEILPAENIGKGQYRISIGELNENMEYGIRIEYNGDIYESAPAKPLRTPEIDSVSWKQPEKFGDVSFYISTHSDRERDAYFLWDYTEDWEVRALYHTTIFYDITDNNLKTYEEAGFPVPAPYYRCWKKVKSNKPIIGSTVSSSENKIDNKQLYRCNPEDDDRFSVKYCVTVSQKAISKEAYEYYQNKLKMNEEMGGLFTPQPSEETGNIICITDRSKRVVGYINVVKNITQHRSGFINGIKENGQSICPGCAERNKLPQTKYDDCDCYNISKKISGDGGYQFDQRPIFFFYESEGGNRYADWAKRFCSDCTAKDRTTQDMPDFWENNE